MQCIDEVIPSAAVPLVARALIEAPEQKVPGDALISRARNLAQGEPLDCEAALRTLAIRRLISTERRGYRTAPGSEKIPAYYANSAYC